MATSAAAVQHLGKLVRFVRVKHDHPKRHVMIVAVVNKELTTPGVVGKHTEFDTGTRATEV
ncbi:hypothetical protein [Antrihabitans stalactiti]|uniref:hypothetical protein n=1 Tax=Antrihabitans stalactiti TaxID=2584121 RepID=UPI00146EEF6B|nr:hypothetical protein [Antrihabitans stalactiti]